MADEPEAQAQRESGNCRLSVRFALWSAAVYRHRMATRRAVGSITKRGDRWYVRLTRPDGRRTTRGSWDSKAAAEAAIPALQRELFDAAAAPDGAFLLQFVEEEYKTDLARRNSTNSLSNALGQLLQCARWLAEQREAPTMREVTRVDAESYAAHLLDGRRATTVKTHLDTLARCWDAALSRGYVDAQVWRKIKLRRDQERTTPWVSPAGLRRLYAHTSPAWAAHMVQFFAETGARLQEAYRLSWLDVNLDDAEVTIRHTKSRKVRVVPLMAATVDMLRTIQAGRVVPMTGQDLVFADAQSRDVLRQRLNAATGRAGLPHLRIHDLRHLYASHLVRSGVPAPTVAALLGHQDGGVLVLQRYGRWAPANAGRLAVDALEEMRDRPGSRAEPRTKPSERIG